MSSSSLNIKNLAIAMEAISRINGKEELQSNLQRMIDEEMELLYKEQHPVQFIPVTPPRTTNLDDEIPF